MRAAVLLTALLTGCTMLPAPVDVSPSIVRQESTVRGEGEFGPVVAAGVAVVPGFKWRGSGRLILSIPGGIRIVGPGLVVEPLDAAEWDRARAAGRIALSSGVAVGTIVRTESTGD